MNIKYINVENHEVMDGGINYVFHENEIKDLPDHLGQYLVFKYSRSFVKVDGVVKEKVKDDIIIKEKMHEIPLKFKVYVKAYNKNKFKMVPFVAGC